MILAKKVAVITGGSRGLGLGIAQAFIQAGAAVVVASRSQKSVDEAVQHLRAGGGQASGVAVDVADLAEVESLAEQALAQFGRLDIWVNNAGAAGPYGPTLGFTPQAFYQVVQTNILGVYNGSFVALQHFTAQRSGKLINILGHGSEKPLPWQNAYGSSKNWIRVFTKALAEETRDGGVGVFSFNPGLVLTEMVTDVEVIEGYENKLEKFPTVLRMWANPPEIPAQKAVWIASNATDGKTGLQINTLSPWMMLRGALREGWRSFTKQPAADLDLKVKPVPHYKKG